MTPTLLDTGYVGEFFGESFNQIEVNPTGDLSVYYTPGESGAGFHFFNNGNFVGGFAGLDPSFFSSVGDHEDSGGNGLIITDLAPTSEPSSFLLLGIGLLGVEAVRRKLA